MKINKKKNSINFKILWTLFKTTFTISSFTFGGGFVIVSLMKKKFVDNLNWLSEEEMLDITAIAQSSPGPIPINAAVMLGYKMSGVLGSVIAILGTAIPPMVIISIISLFYNQFRENKIIAISLQVMRAGVAAVIVDVAINLAIKVLSTKKIIYVILMIISFILAYFFNISAILIILACLSIGIIDLFIHSKKGNR